MAEAKAGLDDVIERLEPLVPPSNWPPAITEQERVLAQQATNDFSDKKYDGCLATLNDLAATRGQDHQLMLNKAVAEYYRSGLTKTNEFRSALSDIGSKVNAEETGSIYDAVDHCYLCYNQAVILYHSRQYRAALNILEKLVPFIEDLENPLSFKVAYFLFDLHISSLQPEKALDLINFIEKRIGSVSSKPGSLEREETLKDEPVSSFQRLEPWKIVVCQFQTRCYLMLKMLKQAKLTLKTLLSAVGMKVNIMFAKSQFELVRGNYQKAVRILNSSPQQLTANDGTKSMMMLMFYNNMGVIHFNMRKPNLAQFYLNKAIEENAATAARLVKKENSKDTTDANKSGLPCQPLQTLGSNQYYTLMYNMGINLLHCGRYQQAFDCLVETVQLYSVNPRLWLRLAECCVMVNKPNNDEDRKLSKKLEVVERSVGSGIHRKLVFGCGVLDDSMTSMTESGAMPLAKMEFASLCLDNAILCLDNPVKIMYDVTASNAAPPTKQEAPESSKTSPAVFIQAPPGNPLPSDEVANLRCSVLAMKSYVSLYHNDHLVALACAEELSHQPRLSAAHRYLASMYKAEALVGLDRISDAVQNLNPEVVTDISLSPTMEPTSAPEKLEKNNERATSDPPEDKRPAYPWSPKDVTQAKGLMMYNLAATYAIRGEYEKASNHLSKSQVMSGQPLPTQMYYLKIYLELMQGHRRSAQNFIRDHFGHMTMNRL